MNKSRSILIILFFMTQLIYSEGYDFIYGIEPSEKVILLGEVVEIISINEFVFFDESGFCLVDIGITSTMDLNLEEGDEVEIFAQSDSRWDLESKRTVYALEIIKDEEIYPIRQVRFSNDY